MDIFLLSWQYSLTPWKKICALETVGKTLLLFVNRDFYFLLQCCDSSNIWLLHFSPYVVVVITDEFLFWHSVCNSLFRLDLYDRLHEGVLKAGYPDYLIRNCNSRLIKLFYGDFLDTRY